MRDIIFYYKKGYKNRERLFEIKNTYPHARFVTVSNSNIVEIVKDQLKNFTTDFVWFVDIELEGWEIYLDYDIDKWDKKYVHIFQNKESLIYLIPGSINLTQEDTEFKDKKIINAVNLKSLPYDVFFITYDESGYERNLRLVKQKNPNVTHISNIKGIFNAHLEAARLSATEFFWVVDADSTILDAFDFDYRVPEWDFDVVHIWKTINPINFLEYGHGGVKLIPRHLILNADEETAVDITTSIGAKIKIMNDVSNINNFATSPYQAWRTAFRECVKLSSGIIPRQNQEETDSRLHAWTTKGGDRPLGEYAKGGASAGEWYGKTYKDNKGALALINDYSWLEEQFNNHIKLFPPETFKD